MKSQTMGIEGEKEEEEGRGRIAKKGGCKIKRRLATISSPDKTDTHCTIATAGN